MDQKTLGKQLQKAREQAGFTQDAVERAIGFPQKALTRIEAGLRDVSTLELSKFAELYHINVADFFNALALPNDNALVVLHRRAPNLERDAKVNQEVAKCIQICREGALLEKLLGQRPRHPLIYHPFPHPKNSVEAIEQGEEAAKEERRRLGIGNFPIYNIVEILSSQGIWAAAVVLPSDMSGLFLHDPSFGMAILVNARHVRSRQRFSYAHEYAHALFDQKQQCVVSDAGNVSDLIEKRANAFAAAFLLPREGIVDSIRKLGKGLSSRTVTAVYDVANEEVFEAESRQTVQKLTPQNVAHIAHYFGVSYQAMVYRLQSLRQIFPKDREELLQDEARGQEYLQFLRQFEDSNERDEKPFQQRELILYLSELILEAYCQEKISRGRVLELCKLLSLSSKKLMEVAEKILPS